jgi:hypothetical protein
VFSSADLGPATVRDHLGLASWRGQRLPTDKHAGDWRADGSRNWDRLFRVSFQSCLRLQLHACAHFS